jgi:hypothetical protein
MCCIILFITGFLIFDIPNTKNTTQVKIVNTEKNNYKYILSDYKGYIALYEITKRQPIKIFNILTESLPFKDINKIKNGIYVSSLDELNALIEEYTS